MNNLAVVFIVLIGGAFALDESSNMMDKECKYSEYAMVFHSAKGYNTSEYMHKKAVAMKLMQKAGMSYMYNRAGKAVYNGEKQQAYYCNQMTSMESAMKDGSYMMMKDDSYMMNDGEVNWYMALEKGKKLLMDHGCGERSDVYSKVIYLFLNGEDYMTYPEMEAAAKEMHAMKIKIIIIVINPSDDAYSYLVKIAGEEGEVYKVPSMKHVAEDEMMIAKMVEPICKHKQVMMMTAMQKCEAYESMYPALMMGDYEISMYPGNCREDKMKYTMKMIMEQMKQMQTKTMAFKKTRKYLQMYVLNKPYAMADLMFGQMNHCTMMIECKLPGWMKMLQIKMDSMKKEMKIMNGGWKSYLLAKLSQGGW